MLAARKAPSRFMFYSELRGRIKKSMCCFIRSICHHALSFGLKLSLKKPLRRFDFTSSFHGRLS